MPGIHIRSLSKLDWKDKTDEPSLTVPGSYWLCHKNNIYKFTFKFHKNLKNSSKFSHSKELMKIIRRVIKWKPKQGQNFSTTNLFVTYNHASWTRQDKMFAMMKFCDRPDAVAFPHAFILTVKIIDLEKEKMGISLAKPNVEKSTNETLENNSSLNSSFLGNSSLDQENINKESRKIQEENENNNKDSSWFLRTRSLERESEDDYTPLNSTERCKESSMECTDVSNAKSIDADCNSKNTENKNFNWIYESEEVSESAIQNENGQRVAPCADDDENSNSSDDTNSDDSSLPYQYLIERDIERENSRNAKKRFEESNTNSQIESTLITSDNFLSDLSSNLNKDFNISDNLEESNHKIRSRQNSRDSDSLPPDVTNLRSSNITDLVMKGLMFTIRQDRDTVTVVEQKTKLLGVDEVLENSEKVETKEGDPCLLNSSLLRLEKMITRMQEPVSLPDQRQNGLPQNALVSFLDLDDETRMKSDQSLNEADIAESKEMCGALETANYWSNFLLDKNFSDSNFDNITFTDSDSKLMSNNLDEDLVLRMESSEEEEDIIPEALLNHPFLSDNFNKIDETSSSNSVFEDSFKDIEHMNETNIDDNSGATEPDELGHSLKLNESDQNSSKTPKIVSNEIITNDQIPPALLMSLKKSFSGRKKDYNQRSVESKRDFLTHTKVKSDKKLEDSKKNQINNTMKLEINEKADEFEELKLNSLIQENEKLETTTSMSENKANFDLHTSLELNDQISRRIKINNSDSSNSVDNTRRTRANSKLYEKNIDINSDQSLGEDKFDIENSNKKTINLEISEVLNNSARYKKRRNSFQDQKMVKFLKNDDNELEKDIQINVAKLISDLTHGLEIVVERLDVNNIPR